MRSHDPNTFKLDRSPKWPDFTYDKRIVLQQACRDDIRDSSEDPCQPDIKSGSYIEEEPEGDKKRCDFVASVYAVLQI